MTVPAAMLLLAAPRASLCAHHLVQVFMCRLNPRGSNKCINIAQISSALYMQNTFIILSFNTPFSHKIVLSAGRTRQMNLFTNDLRMKWYLMNCGLYIQSSIKNAREASAYCKSKCNISDQIQVTYTEHILMILGGRAGKQHQLEALASPPSNVCHGVEQRQKSTRITHHSKTNKSQNSSVDNRRYIPQCTESERD